MRIPRLTLATAVLLSACGRGETTLRGVLAGDLRPTEVWVVGSEQRAAVTGDAFELTGLTGDTLDIRFARDGREVARMELLDVPAGSELTLESVTLDPDSRTAFPDRVVSSKRSVVVVNGLRMADARAVPDRVEADASVLAVSRSGDALLVRPTDESLPDLRVVITPGTLTRTEDGDPRPVAGLEFGDSLHLVGSGQQGYVVASEIVIPRRALAPAASGEEEASDGDADEVGAIPAPAPSLAGGALGYDDRGRGRGKGREKKEKGKGKRGD